jgi:hypothetical protein
MCKLKKSMKELIEQINKQLEIDKKKELENNSELINQFIQFCKKKKIILTLDNFDYIETIGIVATYPDLLNKLNTLLEKNDEELICCKILKKHYTQKSMYSGFLFENNYAAMAHSFFRRNFNSTANFPSKFIELFWKTIDTNIDFYITLDPNRVRIDINGATYSEKDKWYGPKFNKNIEEIPNEVVKLRPTKNLGGLSTSFFYNEIYSLDIKWTENKGIKTFHAEEFYNENLTVIFNGIKYFPVKYIHAEYDISLKKFRHFDGAIHLYTEDEYYQRRETDLNFNEKITKHIKSKTFKIFKMNNNISTETWLEFTSHFFSGNPLIHEYFEGKIPDYITNITNQLDKKAYT